MKIIEPDCYIDYKNSTYHLYFLKNKKELKEDDKDLYKIGGYYTELDSAFKAVIQFRLNKKYPFKCEYKKLNKNLNLYLKYKKDFIKQLKQIYDPIKQLQKELFVYEDKKCNYWKL